MSEAVSEFMSESISEPMSEPISKTGSPIVYVCITCRRAGEPDAEPPPGALLAAAAAQAAAGTQVEVRRLRCLANCTRGPSAAMRCEGSWTYIFGGLDTANAGASDGILPWRGRPEILKRALIARVPPLDFVESDT